MRMERCSECDENNFVVDWRQGERICTGCGLVAESRMIMDQPPAEPLHGTEKWCIESVGTSFSVDRQRITEGPVKLIQVLQKGLHGGSKMNTSQLDDVCRFSLKLPKCIIECAKEIVAKVSQVEQQSSRGKSLLGIQACSVYHACIMQNQVGVPRSIAEIVRAFDIAEPVFTKANHRLKAALEGTKYHRHLFETNKSSDLVTRSIGLLTGLTSATEKQCIRRLSIRILDDFEAKNLLQERTTSSVAAVAIFLALRKSGHKIAMSKYATETHLTGQATLSVILKQLEQEKWELSP